jgi:hypothetical protein
VRIIKYGDRRQMAWRTDGNFFLSKIIFLWIKNLVRLEILRTMTKKNHFLGKRGHLQEDLGSSIIRKSRLNGLANSLLFHSNESIAKLSGKNNFNFGSGNQFKQSKQIKK